MHKSCVLVTGGAGYIGSHAVLSLMQAGYEVAVIDDLSAGRRAAVPEALPFYEGRIQDTDLIARILADHKVEAVMHFAGSVLVPESVAHPLRYYENNTAASRTLMQSCIQTGVARFIFSSTAAVYGNPDRMPLTEQSVTRPINPYGASKLMTETMLCDVHAAHGLSVGVLRYFNVAGADPKGRTGQARPEATHLINVACEAAAGKRKGISIFGNDYNTADGTCVRDYIHVSDLADAHVALLARLEKAGGFLTLNCGYGRGFSVLEVLDAVDRVAGFDIPRSLAPRRAGDPAILVADASALQAELDWCPAHDDLDTIIATALAWERRLVR